jgi:hypothetical protein
MNVNLSNKKTTIFGALAAVFLGLSAFPQFAEYKEVITGLAAICTALAGYFAKDATTGSTPTGL